MDKPSAGPAHPFGVRDPVRTGPQLQEHHAGGTSSSKGSVINEDSSIATILRSMMVFTAPALSGRDAELASHMAEIQELRKLDCTPGNKKPLAVLEARAKASTGLAQRAVRTHSARLNLMDHTSSKSSDRKTQQLILLTDTLNQLVDEDDTQTQVPKSFSARLLLAIACREVLREGPPSHVRPQIMKRLTALMHRTSRHIPPPLSKNSDWIDPKDEWVVDPAFKLAFKAERVEGENMNQRLEHRWEMMTNVFKLATQINEEGCMNRNGNTEQVGWFMPVRHLRDRNTADIDPLASLAFKTGSVKSVLLASATKHGGRGRLVYVHQRQEFVRMGRGLTGVGLVMLKPGRQAVRWAGRC